MAALKWFAVILLMLAAVRAQEEDEEEADLLTDEDLSDDELWSLLTGHAKGTEVEFEVEINPEDDLFGGPPGEEDDELFRLEPGEMPTTKEPRRRTKRPTTPRPEVVGTTVQTTPITPTVNEPESSVTITSTVGTTEVEKGPTPTSKTTTFEEPKPPVAKNSTSNIENSTPVTDKTTTGTKVPTTIEAEKNTTLTSTLGTTTRTSILTTQSDNLSTKTTENITLKPDKLPTTSATISGERTTTVPTIHETSTVPRTETTKRETPSTVTPKELSISATTPMDDLKTSPGTSTTAESPTKMSTPASPTTVNTTESRVTPTTTDRSISSTTGPPTLKTTETTQSTTSERPESNKDLMPLVNTTTELTSTSTSQTDIPRTTSTIRPTTMTGTTEEKLSTLSPTTISTTILTSTTGPLQFTSTSTTTEIPITLTTVPSTTSTATTTEAIILTSTLRETKDESPTSTTSESPKISTSDLTAVKTTTEATSKTSTPTVTQDPEKSTTVPSTTITITAEAKLSTPTSTTAERQTPSTTTVTTEERTPIMTSTPSFSTTTARITGAEEVVAQTPTSTTAESSTLTTVPSIASTTTPRTNLSTSTTVDSQTVSTTTVTSPTSTSTKGPTMSTVLTTAKTIGTQEDTILTSTSTTTASPTKLTTDPSTIATETKLLTPTSDITERQTVSKTTTTEGQTPTLTSTERQTISTVSTTATPTTTEEKLLTPTSDITERQTVSKTTITEGQTPTLTSTERQTISTVSTTATPTTTEEKLLTPTSDITERQTVSKTTITEGQTPTLTSTERQTISTVSTTATPTTTEEKLLTPTSDITERQTVSKTTITEGQTPTLTSTERQTISTVSTTATPTTTEEKLLTPTSDITERQTVSKTTITEGQTPALTSTERQTISTVSTTASQTTTEAKLSTPTLTTTERQVVSTTTATTGAKTPTLTSTEHQTTSTTLTTAKTTATEYEAILNPTATTSESSKKSTSAPTTMATTPLNATKDLKISKPSFTTTESPKRIMTTVPSPTETIPTIAASSTKATTEAKVTVDSNVTTSPSTQTTEESPKAPPTTESSKITTELSVSRTSVPPTKVEMITTSMRPSESPTTSATTEKTQVPSYSTTERPTKSTIAASSQRTTRIIPTTAKSVPLLPDRRFPIPEESTPVLTPRPPSRVLLKNLTFLIPDETEDRTLVKPSLSADRMFTIPPENTTLRPPTRYPTPRRPPSILVVSRPWTLVVPSDWRFSWLEPVRPPHRPRWGTHPGLMPRDEEALDPDEPSGATLAFVFDSTGSMGEELRQVIDGAQRITMTLYQHPDKPIHDYVLVLFNDPVVGPVTQTTDHGKFLQRLRGINVLGGNDCPEMSMSGLLRALEISRPNSYVYVFTDASAKDHHLITKTLAIIQRKQPQVTFLLTGLCQGTTEPGHQVYEKIAAASSGQIYDLRKADVAEVLRYVEGSIQDRKRKVNLLSVDYPSATRGERPVPLEIDDTLKEFTVSLSGSNSRITIISPGGKPATPPQLVPLLDLTNVKVVNIKEPDPGTWTLNVKSDSAHRLRSTGLSPTNFVHGFSVIPTTNLAETAHRPLKSANNSILIKATDPREIYNLTEIKLIGFNGNPLMTLMLRPVDEEPGLFIGGPLIPPEDFFNMEFSGYGSKGFPFKRITPSAITSQMPDLPLVNLKPQMTGWAGHSYKVVCNVESLVPIRVKWYKDNKKLITGPYSYIQSAKSVLELNNLKETDEGYYTCSANNVAGTSQKRIYITVTGPPPVVRMPEQIDSHIDSNLELTCDITSSVNYNVTWARSKSPKSNSPNTIQPLVAKRHISTFGNKLRISNVQLDDAGWYICTVFNKGGKGRGQTYVSVNQPPVVEVQPRRVTFLRGGNFTIACRIIRGVPLPVLSWKKDGAQLHWNHDGSGRVIVVTHGGGRYSELYVRYGRLEDAGKYECLASNSVSTAVGQSEVHYMEPPRVEAREPHQTARVGQPVRLQCRVTSGLPQPTFLWRRLNAKFGGRDLQPTTPEGYLEIKSAQLYDSGIYVCTAKNEAGVSESNITLLVGSPPESLHSPQDVSIEIGGSGKVQCLFSGSPRPKIVWKKNGNDEISQLINKTLLSIKDAKIDDGGKYTCTAENIFGRKESTTEVKIVGIVPPKLDASTSTGEIVKVLVGDRVDLLCPLVAGNPPPTIVWKKDSLPLDQPIYNTYMVENGSLVIPVMMHQHEGHYECIVENIAGSDKLITEVKLYEPPKIDSTTEPYIVGNVGDNVTLPCRVSGDPPLTVTWTKVAPSSIMGNHASGDQHRGYTKEGSNNLLIVDIKEDDKGRYICKAENPAGIARKPIVLGVNVPPQILNWTESVEAISGDLVVLNCSTRAIPRPAITWSSENSTIADKQSYAGYLRFYAKPSDSGAYTCTAENVAGKQSAQLRLIVYEPPRIEISGPSEVVAIVDTSVELPCSVSGNPPPVIIWEHNGGQILDRGEISSNSLEIPRVMDKDKGSYTCIARNRAGTDRRKFELTVMTPPKITPWPETIRVTPGEVVNVVCDAVAFPRPSTVWLNSGGQILPAEISLGSTLRFKAEPQLSGAYTCKATNAAGSDSKDLVIKIYEPPTFVEESMPPDIDVLVGENAEVPCEAMGDPKPQIAWFRAGKMVVNSDKMHFDEQSKNLILDKVDIEDDGEYQCAATNIAGSVKRKVNLNVMVPPAVKLWPTETWASEGDSVALICEVIDGQPKPRISWGKEGNSALPHSHFIQDRILKFVAMAGDSGNYTCTATNRAGTASTRTSLLVKVPPRIAPPHEVEVFAIEGGHVDLECSAQGVPQPFLTWQYDSTLLDNVILKDHPHISITTNDSSKIHVRNVPKNMTGVFSCEAKNSAGTAEKFFNLVVHVAPKILDNFTEKIMLKEGDDFSIPCTADGIPSPNVHWAKGQAVFKAGHHDNEILILDDNTLIISNAVVSTGGMYSCSATNIQGTATKNYTVEVIVPPKATESGTIYMEILETSSGILNCPVQSVTPIKWLKDGQTLDSAHRERADDIHYFLLKGGKTLKIVEAFPTDTGKYTCSATNPAGNTSATFQVQVNVGPQFIDFFPETDFSIIEGGNLTLDCSVYGNPLPKIHWRRVENNVPITPHTVPGAIVTGENRQFLSITGAKRHHQGKYICTAINKIGHEDRIFRVDVVEPPSLEGPEEEVVEAIVGVPAVLECSITGPLQIDYTWTFTPESGFKELLHSKSRNLVLKDVTLENTGVYSCKGTNAAGTKQKYFNVTVLDPPKVEGFEIEESFTMAEGQANGDRLVCKVTGAPKPLVVWLREGHLLEGASEEEAVEDDADDIDGDSRTRWIFSLNVANLTATGRYTCVASNPAGTAEKSFRVRYIAAPKILKERSPIIGREANGPIEVVEGLPLSLRCPVSSDSGIPIQIGWFKDGQPLPTTSPMTSARKNNLPELRIAKTARVDSGNYTCRANNSAGQVELNYEVNILVPPKFRDNSNSTLVAEEKHYVLKAGEDLILNCSSEGEPKPIALWLKDKHPLENPPDDNSFQLIDSNQSLVISSTKQMDSGFYTCIINNIAGATERKFNVEVFELPILDPSWLAKTGGNPQVTVKLNKRSVLRCPLTASPQPHYKWMKDNQTLATDDSKPVQTSSDGKELYIMYAMERDAGNYTCIAENFAGVEQFTFALQILVPLDWTEWSGWDTCSVSCGGGTQSRTRSCGSGTTVKENLENNVKEVGGVKYLEYDTSACQIGDDRQVKSCNVHYCQVAGGWSEWSEWSACSVSCSNNGETGLRSRRRICDNPPPQHGAPPCTGSSDEEEECTVPHCPIHGGWGEWSEWSECSVSCGSGVMTRNRSCDNPTPRYGGSQCRGESRDAALCTKDQCTIMGQWGDWGEWSECSVSCGVGNRIRVRHCSLPIFQEASGCPGDNVEVKTCRNTPCLSRIVESATSNPGLTHASLRVNGRVNGVPLNDRAVTAHFMDNGLRTTVRATAVNHAVGESQDNRAMGYVPFVMPSVAWSTAREKRDATNGLRLTGGKYHQESKFTFSNGQELLVQSDGQGVADSGEFKVDIKMIGEIPTPPTQAVIIISPYEEDVVQTGPNTLYTWANTSIKFDDSEDIPFTWMSTVDYDTDLGSMRFPVEKISTNGIEASYNSSNNVVNYFSSSDVSKKFEDLECPLGFRLMKKYDHCKDIDECKHKRKNKCQSNQICENTIGSYQCLCRHGYKMSPNGKKCIDINECIERRDILCSHRCKNTRGSYKCECPVGYLLADDQHTCITDMMWNDDEDISDDYSAEYPDYRGHGYSGVKFHHTDEIKTSVDGNPFPIEGEPPAAYMLKKDFHEQIGAEEEVWKCKPGYRFTKNFGCKDVNECSDSPPICSAEQICLNTIGSYKCVDSPCPEGFDLHSEPKSCIRWCLGRDDCLEGAKISESFLYAAVSLDRDGDVMSLQVGQPYTDIARLVGFDMKGAPLIGAKTTFEIVQNEAGLPLRTRAEEGGGTGIVYSVDYFVLQKIEKISVVAVTYDEDETPLYSTQFVLFLYNSNIV